MEVFLIRHTLPDTEKGLIYGRYDVPLAESFSKEKEAILKQLPQAIDVVYSSPSRRCTKLAELISPDYSTEEALCELDFGRWETKTWDTINRTESEFWMEDVMNRCPPGGESLVQMKERVLQFWQKITSLDAELLVVVTHKGVIRIILSELNHIPFSSFFDIKVDYGEIVRVSV
ncbi:MAG: alpha-ribazole phosphatase [Bacteroidota bacterium]